mmetsp:Transcript_9345/g.20674  ORF Transcript_9345/g.20674 Transcript_9345/m.20674 type:complete len:221 (+) Transcript_9345:343-1005(+)
MRLVRDSPSCVTLSFPACAVFLSLMWALWALLCVADSGVPLGVTMDMDVSLCADLGELAAVWAVLRSVPACGLLCLRAVASSASGMVVVMLRPNRPAPTRSDFRMRIRPSACSRGNFTVVTGTASQSSSVGKVTLSRGASLGVPGTTPLHECSSLDSVSKLVPKLTPSVPISASRVRLSQAILELAGGENLTESRADSRRLMEPTTKESRPERGASTSCS